MNDTKPFKTIFYGQSLLIGGNHYTRHADGIVYKNGYPVKDEEFLNASRQQTDNLWQPK